MHCESNFEAWLTDEQGRVVPGSRRVGHNVFTDTGRDWLRDLVSWSALSPDVALDSRRFRWVGVGTGSQLELNNIEGLVTPLALSGGDYITTLPAWTAPTLTSKKFTIVFGAGAFGGDYAISEAGIFVDVHDGVGTLLDPSVSDNVPVAYKAFDALTKLDAQTLTVTWEFRF